MESLGGGALTLNPKPWPLPHTSVGSQPCSHPPKAPAPHPCLWKATVSPSCRRGSGRGAMPDPLAEGGRKVWEEETLRR